MSTEEAWKVMAVQILVAAGIVAPENLGAIPTLEQTESGEFDIDEAMLVRVIRIEPAEDARIKRLVARAKSEADISKEDPQKMSSIIRRALRLGLDELERERYQS